MKPAVTVIMTTYNSIRTIESSLRSLKSQDVCNLELVVVDNQSTDGTLEAIKASNIKQTVVSEPDGGIYEAMNKGIEIASGEWIMFLGSDDKYIQSDSISKLLTETNGLDLIYGTGVAGGRQLKNSFDWRMLKGNSINHQCAAYHTRIFKEFKYDTSYSIAADYKLNLQIYLMRFKAKYVHVPVAIFGTDGLSQKCKELGQQEEERIRVELLGSKYGSIVNYALRMKRALTGQKVI